MKNLNKILIAVAFFSLAAAFCVYAEEVKTTGNVPAEVSEVVSAVPAVPPVPAEKTTLDNLQAAFNGESNANAKYLAFAEKAEAEGYGKIASLFRAAARAEQVHFEWHAKLIKEMGGTPAANMETPVVKSTAENVKAAFDGETYENTVMYPEFLKKAEADQNKGAVDAFEDAQAAEGVHASLYKSVMDNMKAWKGRGEDFFVCPVCGNVVERRNFKLCPICGTARQEFIKVR
jgi:rubrerythrin